MATDRAEKSMFHGIPFGGAAGKMADGNLQIERVGKVRLQ